MIVYQYEIDQKLKYLLFVQVSTGNRNIKL